MNDAKPADHALRQAERAAKRGDLAAAERWTKVAAQNQKQWEALRTRPREEVEDVEAIRAELIRRFQAFQAQSISDDEREKYIEAVKSAQANGTPLPSPFSPLPTER